MTTFETPKTPREFTEAMLRSASDADRLIQENINDRWLREAHTHTAVNGHVAALALEMLRRHAPKIAEELAEHLHDKLARGDLAGPTYRVAMALSFDPDQWLTEFNERAAKRRESRAAEPNTKATLTTLAERWEQMAKSAPDFGGDGLFIDEPTPAQVGQFERATTYGRAAADLREVLHTGRIPHGLMTDAELDAHGTAQ
ncbi:hypothetical protein AB0F24_17675 [Streptomyces platensis]|uniref:hypothetical protein n=1 Tax=Streptomyces platensis TaxID=58346 RepID=UPI0033DB417F